MKLYFPHDHKISRAMERIRQAFIKYAPKTARFQGSIEDQPIHCLNYMGQNPKEHTKRDEICMGVPTLPVTEKYLVFAHIGNPHYPQHDIYFQKMMSGALLVITFDKRILGYKGSNVLETSWGYEPDLFYRYPGLKTYKILCTGYMADAEAIDACWDACGNISAKLCHVGGRLPEVKVGRWCDRFEGVSDGHLRTLYNSAEYVSGMRREGGFELPVIEGYACGCQPIVFDQPTMHKYYEDFALFVSNVPRYDLAKRLVNLLLPKKSIRPDPKILKRFQWRQVMRRIWTGIKEVK